MLKGCAIKKCSYFMRCAFPHSKRCGKFNEMVSFKIFISSSKRYIVYSITFFLYNIYIFFFLLRKIFSLNLRLVVSDFENQVLSSTGAWIIPILRIGDFQNINVSFIFRFFKRGIFKIFKLRNQITNVYIGKKFKSFFSFILRFTG